MTISALKTRHRPAVHGHPDAMAQLNAIVDQRFGSFKVCSGVAVTAPLASQRRSQLTPGIPQLLAGDRQFQNGKCDCQGVQYSLHAVGLPVTLTTTNARQKASLQLTAQ